MDRLSNSSSDEDDLYGNSANRLRALKKRRLEKEKLSVQLKELSPIRIEQHENNNEINDSYRQTRSMTVRGNRGRGVLTAVRQTVRQRKRHPPVDNLDCDVHIVSEEKPKSILKTCNNDAILLSDDASSDDDNYEVDIKVFWRSNRIDRLNMHRYDTFQRIFQHYADLEKVSINEILIMKKDKIVNHTDTPVSLKLSIIDILDGGIVNPGMNALSKNNCEDDNICTIKIQTGNKKETITFPLGRDQKFKTLFISCAKQLNVEESSLKLYFDGEQIDPTDTPESLDIEEEACVDLRIST